jgi:hypothetical protein
MNAECILVKVLTHESIDHNNVLSINNTQRYIAIKTIKDRKVKNGILIEPVNMSSISFVVF